MKISIISRSNQGIVEKEVDALFEELYNVTAMQNYSPFIFLGGHRRNETSTPTPLMVYDFDDDTLLTLKQAKELCSHFKSLVVTTRNHLLEKKGKTSERFRVLIPIDEAPPKEMYKNVYLTLAEMLGFKDAIDTQCTDLARYYFGNAKQEVFYSSSEKIITLKEIEAFITEQPNELPHSMYTMGLKINNDILDNELSSTFIFKNGRAFESYEYLQAGDTEPMRCFNHHHNDKHPSAFIGRSKESNRLMVHCKTCNEVKFIHYETAPTTENEGINKSYKGDDIIPKVKVDTSAFNKFTMTKKRREELKQMKYIIDGLIVEKFHTYILGKAGSGKTTVLLNLGFQMVEKGYTVYFFYLDGELSQASKIDEAIEQRQMKDKYHLLVDGTMPEYENILKELIKAKADLNKTIFVLDTFKFLTDDINNKNANKKAMHLIKEVTKLGATFISLGHTNKDGQNFSGTAEIEQDSDAVLRIDASFNDSLIYATIKRDGRCRCDIKAKSFTFTGGDAMSVTQLDEVMDIESENQKQEAENKDKFFIDETKRILRLNPFMLQKDLLSQLDENLGIAKTQITKKLKMYDGKHWDRVQAKEASNGYNYTVKDEAFSGLIESIKNSIK